MAGFLDAVWRRIDDLVTAAPLASDQAELLRSSLGYCRRLMGANRFADALAFFHLIVTAEGGRLDERAEWLAAFCQFYVLALDLLDDVQDDDLAGKPHAAAGPAVAINSGMTLFALALAALDRAMALDEDPLRRANWLGLLTRICFEASRGQHLDLTHAVLTAAEVAETDRAKTSSIVLVAECAARHCGATAATVAGYRAVAENMAVLVQIVGDLRDIFGKSISPDLSGGKLTHPVAAFQELATPAQAEEFVVLVRQGAAGIRRLRELVYESGAVRVSAEAIETARRAIHAAIAGLGNPHPALRTWLLVVDSVATLIYRPPHLAESPTLLQPDGVWHRTVRGLAANFARDMASYQPPEIPPLVAWSLPQWLYDPNRRIVFYPDLDDRAGEVLPWLAALLDTDDLERVRALMIGQAPVVMAHELFHSWRDAAGRLTDDFWYEELVSNRLAAAWTRRFHPDLVDSTRAIAAEALARQPERLSDRGRGIVAHLLRPECRPEAVGPGYGVGIEEMAMIQFAMIPHLLGEDVELDTAVADLLAPAVARIDSTLDSSV